MRIIIFLFLFFSTFVLNAKNVKGVIIQNKNYVYFFPGSFKNFESFLKNSSTGLLIINSEIYTDLLKGISKKYFINKSKIKYSDNFNKLEGEVTYLEATIDTCRYENNDERLIFRNIDGSFEIEGYELIYKNVRYVLNVIPNYYFYITDLKCSKRLKQSRLKRKIQRLKKIGINFNWKVHLE